MSIVFDLPSVKLIQMGKCFRDIAKFIQLCVAGLLTWSSGATLVDLAQELNTISDCSPPGEEARGGEHTDSLKNI